MTATRARPHPGGLKSKTYRDGGLFAAPASEITLGLDPSYSGFGAVALAPSGAYAAWLYQAPGGGVRRLVEIERWITRLVEVLDSRHEIVQIAMEGYAHGARYGREQAGELGATVKLALVKTLGVDRQTAYPTIVAPPTLKKYVTGKGTGDKNTILLKVFQSWGVEFSDDNLADAYALARLAAGWDDVVFSTAAAERARQDFAYRREVYKNLTRYTEWALDTPRKAAG